MQRSLPCRTPACLSPLLQRQLNKYALAASAASVAALALAQFSEAEVVYTPAHKTILAGDVVHLNLNHDALVDFRIKNVHHDLYFGTYAWLGIRPIQPHNKVWGYASNGRHFASALLSGVTVGPEAPFYSASNKLATLFTNTAANVPPSGSSCGGAWPNVTNRFLGLKFQVNGKSHYGWARLSVTCPAYNFSIDAVLNGYAYETRANTPIVTGQKSSDEGMGSHAPSSSMGKRGEGLGGLARGIQAVTH